MPANAQNRFTASDDGAVVHLKVSSEIVFYLARAEIGTGPEVTGDSVLMGRFQYFAASDVQEWGVRAVHSGTSRVSGRTLLGKSYVITVIVD